MLSDQEEMKLLPHSLFLLRRKGNKSCCCSEHTVVPRMCLGEDLSGRPMVPKETSQTSQDMRSFTQQIWTASFCFLEAEFIVV